MEVTSPPPINLERNSVTESGISIDRSTSAERLKLPELAIGPVMPNWGSWEWLGEELIPELSRWYRVVPFHPGQVPVGDVVMVIKHRLTQFEMTRLSETAPILFCPVDHYGSAADIDADAAFLRRCSRVVVHCRRLRKYFTPYAPVEVMDHHVRFVPDYETKVNREGSILWVGARSNLGPLVNWVNSHLLPRSLVVLTNLESHASVVSASSVGFSTRNNVKVEAWSHEHHLERLSEAAAALDIKGSDFRQRHKPPTKAMDFIAAGIPLAMNRDASSVEHLSEMGFEVASPEDEAHWFSDEYLIETRRFGGALRELLSRSRIALRVRRIIDSVLAGRHPQSAVPFRSHLSM